MRTWGLNGVSVPGARWECLAPLDRGILGFPSPLGMGLHLPTSQDPHVYAVPRGEEQGLILARNTVQRAAGVGLGCTGLSWAALDWMGLNWAGLDQARMGWAGRG